jgi:hypothetical protein
MDPFLERPACFPDLHHGLITFMQAALQPRLPVPYFAATNERIWVEFARRVVEPDVDVLRPNGAASVGESGSGGIAVATQTRSQPVVVTVTDDPRTETFLEIYSQREGEVRLVTSIEVLSLSNKTPSDQGRDLYQIKQRQVLNSQVHLIEIDLLRGGQHTTAVPRDLAVEKTGPCDYHVCVRRFDELGKFYVYPIPLDQPLPEIAVPLLPGDTPVPLDLQAAFERAYEAGGYPRRAHYAEFAPEPPLTSEQAAWARRLLQEKGLLPA